MTTTSPRQRPSATGRSGGRPGPRARLTVLPAACAAACLALGGCAPSVEEEARADLAEGLEELQQSAVRVLDGSRPAKEARDTLPESYVYDVFTSAVDGPRVRWDVALLARAEQGGGLFYEQVRLRTCVRVQGAVGADELSVETITCPEGIDPYVPGDDVDILG